MNPLLLIVGVLVFVAWLIARVCVGANDRGRASDGAALRAEVNHALAGAARVAEKHEIKRCAAAMLEARRRGDEAEAERIRDESVRKMRAANWRL